MKKLLTGLLLGLALPVAADSYKIGDLVIDSPYARSTPPLAPVGGGFMTITNNGSEADQLVAGKSSFSKSVEIHQMSMQDGIMKMSELDNGLTIPAGDTVTLKPGSYHLMFINLEAQLKPDEKRKATLTFAKAGDIEVEFLVKDILKMDHSKMKHSEMKHQTKESGDMKTDKEETQPEMDHSKMEHGDMKKDHSATDAAATE